MEGLRGAELQPCQLSAGPAPSELARVHLPGACLDMVHLSPAMLFSGATARDCHTMVFVLACPQPGRSFNFGVEHLDGYMGFFAPGGPLDAITPAGYRNASLTIPVDHFHATLDARGDALPADLLTRGAGLRIPAPAQTDLRLVLTTLWSMIWDPAQPLGDPATRERAGRTVQAAFLNALSQGSTQRVPPPQARVSRRYQRLRQARDFVTEHAHEPIYLEDLSRATGLNHRAVENLFVDLLGIRPTAYLRHQRLHGVRRALREAPPEHGIVKRIAFEWGFWHHGHFARDYRQLFGEAPHETLPAAL